MKTPFLVTPERFMEMSRKSKERNFTEKINAPVLLEAVLAIVAMPEPWSNLEKKDNSSVLKDNFSSREIYSLSHQQNQSYSKNQMKVEFSQYWIQQTTSYPSPQCLVGKIKVHKPTQAVTTNQNSDFTQSRVVSLA